MKSIVRVVSLVLVLISMFALMAPFANATTAKASSANAYSVLSNTRYATIYLQTGSSVTVYKDSNFDKALTTGSLWWKETITVSAQQELRLTGVGKNRYGGLYAAISFRDGNTRRSGYIPMYQLVTSTSLKHTRSISVGSFPSATRIGETLSQKYSVLPGDTVYLLQRNGGWVQIMFPSNSTTWQIRWAKVDEYYRYCGNGSISLTVSTVKQTKNYTCSAAAALAVLRYNGKATKVSDTTLYKSTAGYVYKIANTINSYMPKSYTYTSFPAKVTDSNLSKYEAVIRDSLDKGNPVIARVAFSKEYFNYKSSGHYTTIVGIYTDVNGRTWLSVVDSYVHNYASNTYTNATAGHVRVPLDVMYKYGTYSGTSSVWLIYGTK